MAIREYIGARYVPKFYDDGQGSAEWTPDVQYEPLTIVLHEGNSFTSRQYVPVGIDINNTNYWLETGNWNSQIEAYRQEVLTFDGRITDNTNNIEQEVEDRQAEDTRIETALSNSIEQEAAARQAGDAELKTYLSKIDNVVVIGDSWTDGWNGTTGITPWQTYMNERDAMNEGTLR